MGWFVVAAALVAGTSCGDGDDDSNGSGASAGTGAGAAGTGGTTGCSSLSHDPCQTDPECLWIEAGCHGVVLFEDCFDQNMHPSPPPCADQPCPAYDTEPDCAAQDACRWWPLDCSGKTITDQCLNIGFGNPEGTCP
jgi:hypothetical protein